MTGSALLAVAGRSVQGRVEAAGRSVLDLAWTAGSMGLLFGRVARAAWRLEVDGLEHKRALYKMGVRSIPVVLLTALFTGSLMVVQAAPIVQRYGAEQLLGWGAGFGTLREIGPLLTALMISGRVGANNTAELGTMVITEQIDGLRALAIDPIGFLVAPRVLAIVETLFLATLYADFIGLVGAAIAGRLLVGTSPMTFYEGLTSGLLSMNDVVHGLVKSVVFGWMIALSSCHFGMSVTGGATGVGRAVNATVVASAAGIFALDYFVSFLLG